MLVCLVVGLHFFPLARCCGIHCFDRSVSGCAWWRWRDSSPASLRRCPPVWWSAPAQACCCSDTPCRR
ncbi:hypothetical protein NKG94_45160 [Micromonospora sp. M12]